ncbi:MAG: transglutaminase domain-containing protein [Flavobacteriaceae bacterium]|nr:transglutaminase domain-containing protein [Flavobacteriaceae bacterium]
MKIIFTAILLFFSLISIAQTPNPFQHIDQKIAEIPDSLSNSTDKIAAYINTNFKTDEEKIRAIFYFTASKINYDVVNMFTINLNLKSEEIIKNTLETRKGVCINYAEVFNDLSNKAGIKSVIIEGYTKQNGKIDALSHAWCAAYLNHQWFVFDPTWGAGHVINGKYIKKINEQYFKSDPSKIIVSHMPFDYLWQFLNYPITNEEFYKGMTQINKSKTYFDYEKEIGLYENYSESLKLVTSSKRIEQNGVKNALIAEILNHKKIKTENLKQAKLHDDFNKAISDYNDAVYQFNAFIDYRNRQFKPIKSDEEIKKMIDDPKTKLINTQYLLNNLGAINVNNQQNLISLRKSLSELLKQVEEQEDFVKVYLSKNPNARKKLFTQYTFFGMPLN